MKIQRLFCIILAILNSFAICDDEQKKPQEKDANKIELSEDELIQLKKNKILVTQKTYKKMYQAYSDTSKDLFITSDSILNAFHFLLENTMIRLEMNQAKRLPHLLKLIMSNIDESSTQLKGDKEIISSGRTQAKIIVGVALKILDQEYIDADKNINEIINTEIKKIDSAKNSLEVIDWLPKFSNESILINYSQFKPTGFYINTKSLQNYYKAMRWLQSIPFRVDVNEDLMALLIIVNTYSGQNSNNLYNNQSAKTFLEIYKYFFQPKENFDITNEILVIDYTKEDSLKLFRTCFRNSIFDSRNEFNKLLSKDEFEKFYICSPQKTLLTQLFNRFYLQDCIAPSGLIIPAALENSFARKILDSQFIKLSENEIKITKEFHIQDKIYAKYLKCLSQLVTEPDKDAPAFMKTNIWQIKSTNTLLSSQVQWQNICALKNDLITLHWHKKRTAIPFILIESNPDFFHQMAEFIFEMNKKLNELNVFSLEPECIIDAAMLMKDKIESLAIKEPIEKNNFNSKDFLIWAEETIRFNSGIDWTSIEKEKLNQNVKIIDNFIEDFKNRKLTNYNIVIADANEDLKNLQKCWYQLENLSYFLSHISHKQLRKVELTLDDRKRLREYSSELSSIMLDTCQTEELDSKTTKIITTIKTENKFYTMAVGFPQQIYVIYDDNGVDRICSGAIMPYYEFPSQNKLNNNSWLELLKSKDKPKPPDWAKSLYFNIK